MTDAFTPIDPRLGAEPSLSMTPDGPIVGKPAGGSQRPLIIASFALLAIALFFLLNARRVGRAAEVPTAAILTAPGAAAAYEPPALQMVPPDAVAPPPAISTPAPLPAPMVIAAPPASPPGLLVAAVDQRSRAPAVVVDLQSSSAATPSVKADAVAPAAAAAKPATSSATASPLLAGSGANAQIAALIGEGGGGAAVATQMSNLGAVVPQGAMIPGVLETAINSDLPGYTRAVVSRDVRSFDGRAVLIPRGSRLIGQYRSAVALGQSRVFVIWTRAIRPDGVSVDLGSPGADALGRGGLQGEVNTHFFSRFGGSILLSVLNAGIASIGRTPSTQITIGSPGAAAGAAAAATTGGDSIAPTITIKQGEAINIFVARDLDFSNVQAVK